MSYVIQVVLSNARHPEYGQFTIPFPIPQDAYDDMVEALKTWKLEIPYSRTAMWTSLKAAIPS